MREKIYMESTGVELNWASGDTNVAESYRNKVSLQTHFVCLMPELSMFLIYVEQI